MSQHWSIDFFEESMVDFDDIIRPDAKNVLIVGGVVNLAQRQPIRDYGLTLNRPGVSGDFPV